MTCRASEKCELWFFKILYKSYFTSELCSDGDVRLIPRISFPGHIPQHGRVEVCINEVYGTICDRGFAKEEALVICGQLGFSKIRKLNTTRVNAWHSAS